MTPAAIGVTVATLWAAPDRTRPSDAAALRDEPDLLVWIAAMTPAERTDGGVVTQLLLGDHVLVEEVRADGWARVVAPGQPAAGLDPRGYPGWMPAAQLTTAVEGSSPLVVAAVTTAMTHSPGGPVALPGVMLGTLLTPAGPAADGWLPVRVAGHAEPLWALAGDLVPVPPGPPTGAAALDVARHLLGTAYVWGGMSTLGIDCSGLIHLVWRRLGVRLPRDAHEQATATTAVPPGAERPGDLYFFAHAGRRVHHVGIVTGPGRMLHASPGPGRVVEEPMPPQRAATLAGIHRPGH